MSRLRHLALIPAVFLAGCVADVVPQRYAYPERVYPEIPGQTAPYEVWLHREGSGRWVMFQDVTRSTCTSAVVEFRADPGSPGRRVYDLKKSGLYKDNEFPGFLGCTETYSFWWAPGQKIISVAHASGEARIISYEDDIFWPDRQWSGKERDAITIQTRSGVFELRPDGLKKMPNQPPEPTAPSGRGSS